VRPEPRWPRVQGWPERLAEFLAERAPREFEWGEQDCVSLAADAAVVLTGRDPLTAYRGRYADEAEAYRLVGEDGLAAFVGRLMEEFGAPECPVRLAQRGDWAMVTVGNHFVTGIVTGSYVAAPGVRRLAHVPLSRAVLAWAV